MTVKLDELDLFSNKWNVPASTELYLKCPNLSASRFFISSLKDVRKELEISSRAVSGFVAAEASFSATSDLAPSIISTEVSKSGFLFRVPFVVFFVCSTRPTSILIVSPSSMLSFIKDWVPTGSSFGGNPTTIFAEGPTSIPRILPTASLSLFRLSSGDMLSTTPLAPVEVLIRILILTCSCNSIYSLSTGQPYWVSEPSLEQQNYTRRGLCIR
mmetsp:Transcript_21817/g.31649  ORF Transcript_21817/g.31649 Transcript_21817/m.31649 type:complete len:214 (-) Transcript_21817:13-654(-)